MFFNLYLIYIYYCFWVKFAQIYIAYSKNLIVNDTFEFNYL